MRTEPSDKTATTNELLEIMALTRRMVGLYQGHDEVSGTIKSGLNIALATWSIACPREGFASHRQVSSTVITTGEIFTATPDMPAEKELRVMTATVGAKTRPKASPNPEGPPAPPPPPPPPPAPPKLRSKEVPKEPARRKAVIPANFHGRKAKKRPSDSLFGDDDE